MFTLQPIHTIALLAAIFLIGKCYAHPGSTMARRWQEVKPLCVGCGDECNKCEHGVTVTPFCKIEECRRGPGEICGGPNQAWGECGEGLSCNCNRCTGCSLQSLLCFHNQCLPHQALEQRGHYEIIDRLPIAK